MTAAEIASDDSPLMARQEWPRCLLALNAAQIREVAHAFAERFQVEDVQLPQSGLGLMKIRDDAMGELFFAGEIPLATARVRITTPEGAFADGAAQVLDDRAGLARNIAILDAVLDSRLPGYPSILPLLQEGQNKLAVQRQERKSILETTRVNFSSLGYAEDDDV